MTVTKKTDEEAVDIVPDEALLVEAEKEDADYRKLAHEAEENNNAPTSIPFTWNQCFAGYKSYFSRNAAFSALTCNGVASLLTLNGLFCIFVVNGFGSIFSLNSVFSIGSMNCAFCIGCEGTTFCIGNLK